VGARGIAILGATGSVGCSTLDVIARHPQRFNVVALSGHRNVQLLARQCLQHQPQLAVVADEAAAAELRALLGARGKAISVGCGPAALLEMVAMDAVELVMAAIVGAAGLEPTLKTAQLGKQLLLANKESMVIAGKLFEQAQQASGCDIIPVDSEHNALFQALPRGFRDGLARVGVDKLILTASGGPFLNRQPAELQAVTPEQACAHPNWDMGRKISVDSATLMNKGLEVIEARWLFNAQPGEIDVVVHPQSIVHSLVSYRDGSVLAQLGMPDMRTPIAHALAWPERIEAGVARLKLSEVGRLEFFEPDLQRFPCLQLAYDALASAGSAPAILNAANEVAVQAFLDGRIGFMQIPQIIDQTLNDTQSNAIASLADVLEADAAARRSARAALNMEHS
jgi:1-deoxy-D-xylulose-5-phosphate reductoisomerase